jgi:tetratricopeptide (TPR) repeat protein
MKLESRTSRLRWLVLAVLAALATGGVATGLAWHRLSPGPIAAAAEAYRRGDWSLAERLAANRLKTSPDDRQALRLRARAAARLWHGNLCRVLYKRLGGVAAMEAEDFLLFGRVLFRLGDPQAARDCWSAGLDADPDHPELLHEVVSDWLREGKPVQAALLARRLAKQAGWEDRGDVLLGKALLADDDPVGAVECWTRALGRNPSLADQIIGLRGEMARAWLRAGRPDEARVLLQATGQQRVDPERSWLLNRTMLQLHSTSAAAPYLEEGRSYREAHPLEREPAPFVGSARCRECHREVSDAVLASRHSRTFWRDPQIAPTLLPAQPLPDPGDPTVLHTIRPTDRGPLFQTRDRERLREAVVSYAFGSGKHGMTLVGADDEGRARELRLSLYEHNTVWDITTGQTTPPKSGHDHLGRILSPESLRECFSCHTTVARSARDRTGPESADLSIGCERCHGPGGNHLIAMSTGFADAAIVNPGAGRGDQVVALCGGCHSPRSLTVTPADPLAPRFPATGLTWSRCFTESQGGMDCLTCHDPHRNAETSRAYYEQKCLECHSSTAGAAMQEGKSPGKASSQPRHCTINPASNCLECHMPVTRSPVPHTRFTDHHIRIRREGDR